jgi:hypothetical protein
MERRFLPILGDVSQSELKLTANSWFPAVMASRFNSIAVPITLDSVTGRRCNSSFPEVIRETSSRSSIIRTICPIWRSIIGRTESMMSGRSRDQPYYAVMIVNGFALERSHPLRR